MASTEEVSAHLRALSGDSDQELAKRRPTYIIALPRTCEREPWLEEAGRWREWRKKNEVKEEFLSNSTQKEKVENVCLVRRLEIPMVPLALAGRGGSAAGRGTVSVLSCFTHCCLVCWPFELPVRNRFAGRMFFQTPSIDRRYPFSFRFSTPTFDAYN